MNELSNAQIAVRAKIQINRRIRKEAIRAVMNEGDKFIFPKEQSTAKAFLSSKSYEGYEGEYRYTKDGWVYVTVFLPCGRKPCVNLSIIRFYEILVTLGKIERQV